MTDTTKTSPIEQINRIPRPLAEELDLEIAQAALRKYESKRTPNGMLRSAWNYAEYALNTRSSDAAEIREYFRTTQDIIALVLSQPKVHQDVAMNALTLSTFIPLLEKRAIGDNATPSDCAEIYKSLGHAMQYLRPLSIDEPPQWRMTEVSMLALAARARQPQLLMYPTSPREESSIVQSLNHDSYFHNGVTKIPVQQKLIPTQKVYDECIKILTVEPILQKAIKRTGGLDEQTLGEKVNYLLSLIIAETHGQPMTRAERNFLNHLTESVVSHYPTSPASFSK